ncbi:MAG TPA: hypothetical protein VHE79_09590 [Spirochaetia bacterium]
METQERARLDDLVLHVLSCAAQLLYVEDARAAYDLLVRASRFYRYAVAADRMVTLTEEIRCLEDYRVISGCDARGGLRVELDAERLPASIFVERMAIVRAVGELAESEGDDAVLVDAGDDAPTFCRVSRGRSTRTIPLS